MALRRSFSMYICWLLWGNMLLAKSKKNGENRDQKARELQQVDEQHAVYTQHTCDKFLTSFNPFWSKTRQVLHRGSPLWRGKNIFCQRKTEEVVLLDGFFLITTPRVNISWGKTFTFFNNCRFGRFSETIFKFMYLQGFSHDQQNLTEPYRVKVMCYAGHAKSLGVFFKAKPNKSIELPLPCPPLPNTNVMIDFLAWILSSTLVNRRPNTPFLLTPAALSDPVSATVLWERAIFRSMCLRNRRSTPDYQRTINEGRCFSVSTLPPFPSFTISGRGTTFRTIL